MSESGSPSPTPTPPPRLAVALLTLVTRADDLDGVLGDLEEGFVRRLSHAGRARARAWYWKETLRSLGPLLACSIRIAEGTMTTGIGQDLRGAARLFTHAPGFALVVVLTLAIGVGGATAVYSVLRAVVLAPLPFDDSERVVALWGHTAEYPRMPLTVGDHNALESVRSFSELAASWGNSALLLGEAEPEQVAVGWVTPAYFDLLRIRPALGRALGADDHGSILIAHDLWVRRWGADPSVVGRTVDLGGERFEIAGVLPERADPNLTAFSGRRTEYSVWRLQPSEWTQGDDRSVGWLRSSARLRDGVRLEQAQQEVDALMARVNETVTSRDGGADLRVDLIPVRRDLVGDVARTLWVMLAAVCGVLLIAATNVAHLMLARTEARGGDVAVRAALGGSRLRIVRQLLVEAGALAVVGGAAGLLVARWGVAALRRLAPPELPRVEAVGIDPGVLVFASGAAAATALVFGVVPALRATRGDLAAQAKRGRATPDPTRQRLSRGLVVAQVALSLALVSGTGMLLRSLDRLDRVDLGFEPGGVVTFAVEAPSWGAGAEDAEARMRAYLERMRSVPGVTAAGFTNRVPLAGGLFTGSFRSEEMAAAGTPAVEASVRYLTPGYLEAMGARLVAGRDFREGDRLDVVLLDAAAAERAWPGQDALGRRVLTTVIGEEDAWAEVVGVVAPMKHDGVALAAAPTVFVPMLSRAHLQNFRYAAVRVDGDPLGWLDALRAAVREVDGGTVLAGVRTMDDLVGADVAATRFATLLLLIFGALALVLATVGLHGVMACAVRRRTRELAIRVALGAERRRVVASAVASGVVLVGWGVALGAGLSLGLGSLLGSLLYEVRPSDPGTLMAAAALIAAVGVIGAYLPARHALSVDPARSLRSE